MCLKSLNLEKLYLPIFSKVEWDSLPILFWLLFPLYTISIF